MRLLIVCLIVGQLSHGIHGESIDITDNKDDHVVQASSAGAKSAKISAEEMLKLHRKRRDDLFSINSPRNKKDQQPPNNKEIHIKLPENISEQMAKSHQERTKLRDTFLGFPDTYNDPVTFSTTSTSLTTQQQEQQPTSPFQDTRKISHPKQANIGLWEDEDRTTPPSHIEGRTVQVKDSNSEETEKVMTRSMWAIAWDAHIYFSGTLFVLLSLYCCVNILRLHTFSRLFSRSYFVSLNLLLVVIGILRPIWLFHDPYNEGKYWPRTVAYLLVDTGLPCMTSAFAVLFLALLRATQIELVSPAFQTPKALAIFCFLHFALSQTVDVTIGFYFNLRYMVLINQGIFIVWSLLLSAGYFYIFSAMNKVAMRQQGDLIRSVYPKLILEGGNAYNESTGQMQPLSSAVLKKPPLARAVHLTLGVAVLGSLLGGVQLFAMIKMLGLIKQDYDMSPTQNQWAWYGYQVSMRVLEVTLCTLLAIIATTPLRSDEQQNAVNSTSPGSTLDESDSCCCCFTTSNGNKDMRGHHHRRPKRSFCWCFGDANPPREFEDEIYSEICSNNHSVRQVLANDHNGTMMALGTLNHQVQPHHQTMLAMGSNTLMPYGHKRAQAAYATQSATLLRSSNHSYNGAFLPPSANNHRASSGGVPSTASAAAVAAAAVNSSTSSRVTLDTQLYSNIRSRPSSMLFNDSGFVRFRMGNDNEASVTVANDQSVELLTSEDMKKKGQLRASQSFDEAVLQDAAVEDQPQQPRKSPIYHTASDPETKEDDFEPELEAIYEPPPMANRPKKQSLTTPSESDEPQYSGQSLLYGRAPSQCSSISATQSFDLRMYGRLPNKAMVVGATTGNAVLNNTTGTLKKNEETRERLENPYYYYGSTRNQKKAKLIQQKPRPLLPSQRAALEMQQRAPAFVSSQLPGERPKSRQQQFAPESNQVQQRPPSRPSSRQALLQHELQDQQQQQNFTRSRSLGGYYQQQAIPPPIRNQQLMRATVGLQGHPQQPGSMTPLSYAKWQQNNAKRYNPLYDTPPTQRHPPPVMRPQGLQMDEIRCVMGSNASPISRTRLTEPVLSPILTDTEISPLHGNRRATAAMQAATADYLTDPSDSEDDAELFTSQATQGYSEGLADNEQESEVSSIFGIDPVIPDLPRNHDNTHISPLEYSAMLKLYRSGMDPLHQQGNGRSNGQQLRNHLKDATPDSGVVADTTNLSNTNSNQSTSSSQQKTSQNSLLSSSSSTAAAEPPIWQQQPRSMTNGLPAQASSIQHHGKEYSRLEAPLNHPDTLFSSEASSSDGADEETTDKPSFRWDGTPLVDKSKESKLVKQVKSLEEQQQKQVFDVITKQRSVDSEDTPPIPPIRESSVKREEIK